MPLGKPLRGARREPQLLLRARAKTTVSVEQARRALALSDEALLAECDEQFFTASGPGGQHRNKTQSGVRLTHGPTGVTVAATERRSQLQNRHEALDRLRRRLEQAAIVPEKRIATKPTRGSTRRRLEAKKKAAEKKHERKRDWE